MMQSQKRKPNHNKIHELIRQFQENDDENAQERIVEHAVPTIIGEKKRHLRDKTWSVHVPRKMKELGSKINSTVDELTKTLQRSPKVGEIADYLEEDVLQAMEIGKNYQVLSVDQSFKADKDGGTTTILDVVGQNEIGYEHINQKLTLERALPIFNRKGAKNDSTLVLPYPQPEGKRQNIGYIANACI
mgnify:CR=1 FL=1